jgi:NAD-dependent deacetylase
MEDLIAKGSAMIAEAQKILVFTGAGLSTESGIPDFRSPGGIWDKYDPSEFYFDRFISSEAAREKYWAMSYEYYETMKSARPNRAHLAIAALEEKGKLLCLVTQNIDNLHHRAGNSPEKIIEIHGTAFSVSCLKCGGKYDRDRIQMLLSQRLKAPYCKICGGILKPDTVSFGQAMPQDKMQRALDLAGECDLCVVMGSSLVVYPAASIPACAAEAGAQLIIINRDPTPLDDKATLVIHESVTRVFGSMVGL